MNKSIRRFAMLSGALHLAGWLVGALGVAAGVTLAAQSEQVTRDFFTGATDTTYPYVNVGIAVAAGALLTGLVLAWLGYAGRFAAANASQRTELAPPTALDHTARTEWSAPQAPVTGNVTGNVTDNVTDNVTGNGSPPTKWAPPHTPAEPAPVG